MTIKQPGSTMKNTVLVIDDEPLIRDVARLMLENVGYDVLVAEDGVAGAEVAAQHRREILLILCDLRMPGMDGWQTIAALREVAPEVPIALMSGQTIDAATRDQYPAQPWETIQKPFAFHALNDLLQKAKDAQPPLDPC
jgi:two-component system, cell cycle sensor histidine kinase and response regulator CckA